MTARREREREIGAGGREEEKTFKLTSSCPCVDATATTFDATAPTFDAIAPTFDATAPTFDATAPTFSMQPLHETSRPLVGGTQARTTDTHMVPRSCLLCTLR